MQNADTGFFGHPRGLATLFFIEMWERFSYYGMRALLILFMTAPKDTGGLAFPVTRAGAIYGLYTAMVYLLGLPGGWFADRISGQRKAVLYGGILIAAGQFCLAAPAIGIFYFGLVLLIFGTGLLKPNVSTIVGQLYGAKDHRRDAGFSIFYIGINVGALISPLICGYIGERISWRLGFGAAGIGMLAGLVQYVLGAKYLGLAGNAPVVPADAAADQREKRNALIGAGTGLAIAVVCAILASTGAIEITPEMISNTLGVLLVIVSIAIFSWLIFGAGWSVTERKRFGAVLVLFIASCLFWAIFEQAGSSLNLFAERNTNDSIFGYQFPASWFQSVQPILVVLLAPVFAWLWVRLGNREPSSPAKFSFGLLFVGVSLAILVIPAHASEGGARVSPMWLTTTYFLQTIAELCLSPIGLSAMTKLAPARVGGLIMGVWFLSISIGNFLAGRAASLYESMPLPTLFGAVGGFVICASFGLVLLVRPTERLMSGVK
ncbi:MAG TPA: peptide MFS transporter [Bryobacteraceae bacterium]|nr:peptide MFS transporter [Bryobacteraceae bacterium]